MMQFECKDIGKGDCEGKLRLGGHGLHCTEHHNQHAEEFGVFTVTDNPTVVQGNDDYNRRHPK